MTRKIISWLPLWAVFLFTLSSCVHDEVYSASDPESGEYTNKSLWKEDEKYIKNVKQVFDEYADHQYFSSSFGTVYWDYATTMGTYDESFLEVPVVRNSKVSFILVAYREGDRVFFKRKEEDRSKEFFQVLLFKDRRQLSGKILEGAPQSKGVVCYTQEITWTWTNDDGSEGPTYIFTETRCEHSGPYLPCQAVDVNQTCGGSGGGYGGSSGGGGGNNGYPYPQTQTPPNPCEKTKNIINNTAIKAKIDDLKTKSTGSLENAYKFKADGTTSNLIVGGKHEVDFGDKTGFQGGYHNHTTGTPMFSPADIEQLLQFALAQGNYGDPSNAFLGMVAPNGMHYVIQFNGNYNDALVTYSQEQLKGFKDDYGEWESDLRSTILYGSTYRNSDGSINNLGVETLFFKILKKMNLNETINLQRIETNGIIQNINLDGNNQPASSSCS